MATPAWSPGGAPEVTTPAAAAAGAKTGASEEAWTPKATPAWSLSGAPEVAAPAAAAAQAPSTVPPSAPARKPSVARPSDGERGERPPWMLPAIIALVLILLLGAGGGIYLATRHPASVIGKVTHTPTPPKSSPKASPSPTGVGLLPIPDYGATANSPLTSVKFCSPSAPCVFGGGTAPATDTHCTLGGPCHVDVAASWSGNAVNTLTFTIVFFARCNNPNNTSTTVLHNTYQNVARYRPIYDPAPAGGFALTLPSGVKAAVLVAIADTGTVKAASAPFPLGASSCS